MRLKYLLIIVFLPLLCGCSFPTEFYVVNKTARPVKIELYYNPGYIDTGRTDKLKFMMTNKICKIRASSYKKFAHFIYAEYSIDKISVVIPPSATCYAGSGMNTHLFGVEKVVFYEKDTTVAVSTADTSRPFQHTWRGLRHAMWYEIKESGQS